MNNPRPPSFLEKLFNRTGARYPILILLSTQTMSALLLILLTAMPAQQNAGFSKVQGVSLLIFGGMALLVRNVLLLVQFYYFNSDMIARLSKRGQPGEADIDPRQEKRAWEQAASASRKQIWYEWMGSIIFVLAPTLLYGYFGLNLSVEQTIYLCLSALAAVTAVFLLKILTLDRFFQPILLALLPKQFETQLAGIKGIRLKSKLILVISGLVTISLLLVVPSAFHQVKLLSAGASRSAQDLVKALLVIVNAGIGAIVIGIFLSFQLIVYFSTPFRRIIRLFNKIEEDDLSQRIQVSFPDEFGELNIHVNHTIDRLQKLTSSLEQQVADRTAQLSQVNEQLLVELAERKRMEELLAYTALHDPLTNLPNRALFMDRLQHAMERARRHDDFTFAVIFLDLDRFKVVNDSLGHNIGDLLLTESASRLAASVRSEDSVARLGGDEFVILLEDMKSTEDYLGVADRILSNLAIPANLDGNRVSISLSMGIVFSHARYELPEDILRDADIAMYHAKRRGRGHFEVFDPAMLDSTLARVELENDLRRALENWEFVVHYQPILDLQAHRIVGFEALARWQHPTRGLILPSEFLPAAEEIGIIVPIGYWILDEACRQIRVWQEAYPADPPLTVNVNWSPRQCVQTDLIQRIVEILNKNQLDPGCLKLELAESLVVEDSAFISGILSKLRDLGIQVQIDDFGTRYSSLSYLHTLPIDALKIDRAFIGQMGDSGSGSEIVRTILALAHGLGMKVVAEGVETDEQLSSLKTMGCEFVQGYRFVKPIDSSAVSVLLGELLAGFDL